MRLDLVSGFDQALSGYPNCLPFPKPTAVGAIHPILHVALQS
jgi:hypothetical protein